MSASISETRHLRYTLEIVYTPGQRCKKPVPAYLPAKRTERNGFETFTLAETWAVYIPPGPPPLPLYSTLLFKREYTARFQMIRLVRRRPREHASNRKLVGNERRRT